jgi:hypothetical protein
VVDKYPTRCLSQRSICIVGRLGSNLGLDEIAAIGSSGVRILGRLWQ